MLPADTKKAFDFLAGQGCLKDSGWYLAGGTALALLVGQPWCHRASSWT
jgi:hypothetical protein